MLDVLLEKNLYTSSSLKEEILQKIGAFPTDSILRFKMKNKANISLLNVKLLDDIIPATMNYQLTGLRDLYAKNK